MADLAQYGLTEYESAVYKTLVRTGLSSAHEISQKSKVPYGKIYTVLATLEEKGFIRKHDGRPQKFSAVDPKVAIEEQVRKKEQEILQFKQQADKNIRLLGELAAKKTDEALETIKIVEGQKNYLNLSVALHKNAKESYCSISRLTTVKTHVDSYAECIKRGVKVRILVCLPDTTEEKIKIWKGIGAELRGIDRHPTRFSIIDGNQVTMRLTQEKKYITVWIQNEPLANILDNYLETLWKDAKPL